MFGVRVDTLAGRPERRPLAWVVALVIGAQAAACTAGPTRDHDVPAIERSLHTLVVLPEDLTVGTFANGEYERFDEGPLTAADHGAGPRGDAMRFGRVAGWKARFRHAGGSGGVLVVDSRVDLFPDAPSAAKDLTAYRSDVPQDAVIGASPADASGLADETLVATYRQPGSEGDVVFAIVAWREELLTASVTVNGFEGEAGPDDALALARRVQRRIAEAVGG